jgi:O-antigen/teichoic acid export membrane protein
MRTPSGVLRCYTLVVRSLALSIVSLGAVVGSLGLPKTVVGLVAESKGVGRPGRARRVIRTVLGLGVFGALGIGLAYLLVGDLVSEHLFHSSLLVGVTRLMAGWIAIAVTQEITAGAFRGFHDIRLATLLGGLATAGKSSGLIMRVLLLGVLALLWVRSEQASLATVMLVCLGSGSVSVVLSLWLLHGKLSTLGPSEGTEDEEPVGAKEVLGDAIPFLAIALTSFVLLSADVWILGALGSLKEVGIYGAASRLITFVTMPLLVVNLVLPPIVSEMYARGETGRLERTLRTFSTLAGVPSLLVLLVFMLLGGPILALVYAADRRKDRRRGWGRTATVLAPILPRAKRARRLSPQRYRAPPDSQPSNSSHAAARSAGGSETGAAAFLSYSLISSRWHSACSRNAPLMRELPPPTQRRQRYRTSPSGIRMKYASPDGWSPYVSHATQYTR